jgi:hypothetical protein
VPPVLRCSRLQLRLIMDKSSPEDRFFDVLAGRKLLEPGATGLLATADALRERLTVERAAEQAFMAPAEPTLPSADESVAAEAAWSSLGSSVAPAMPALKPNAMTTSGTPTSETMLRRLRDLVVGEGWLRPVAFASVMGLATVLGFGLLGPGQRHDDADGSAMRGGGQGPAAESEDLQWKVADAAASSQELAAKLESLGATATAAEINSTTWAIAIRVPELDARTKALAELKQRGIDAPDLQFIRLVVRQVPSAALER